MDALLRPCGDAAVLVELPSLPAVLGLHAALAADRPPGVVDLVPGARTLLVVGDPVTAPPRVLADWVRRTAWEPRMPDAASDAVELPVRYDGPDLAEVAALLGRSPEAVVALHTASRWTAAFGGFAPGFAYLVTDHEELAVPRRAEARLTVPAGAVGLAGPFSGVYPRPSPGGWRLIGRTDAVLWDGERGALLKPGTPVRFRAVVP
jgi:KipI family sensor histidine kinase inhibitor